MKKVLLNNNEYAIVDDEDFDLVSQYNWSILISRKTYKRAISFINGKTVYMHKLVLNFPKNEIDHVNHNPLDNRKSNLRSCTRTQNCMNFSKKVKKKGSKYKGVIWEKQVGKFRARITIKTKTMHLGLFDKEINAAKAYNEAALKYFGEFANLNRLN